MSNRGISDGEAISVIVVILLVIGAIKKAIEAIPKDVWIVLGVTACAAAIVGLISWGIIEYDKSRAAAEEEARAERAARDEAAKRDRAAKARKEKQQRIKSLGAENAAFVESAIDAMKQIRASEAAQTGWLGDDIDFTVDIRAITEDFRKAHALRKTVNELSALDKPSADDQKLLAEAESTIANLQAAALEKVGLITACATEARRIDKSLQDERREARTAEQRAELHARLSAMLYGAEAAPNTTPRHSAADAVMARVLAYREIKDQIQQGRDV